MINGTSGTSGESASTGIGTPELMRVPRKAHPESQAKQSARFRTEVEKLIDETLQIQASIGNLMRSVLFGFTALAIEPR